MVDVQIKRKDGRCFLWLEEDSERPWGKTVEARGDGKV